MLLQHKTETQHTLWDKATDLEMYWECTPGSQLSKTYDDVKELPIG